MSKDRRIVNNASRTQATGLLQHQWLRSETITRGAISVTPVSRRVSLGLPGWLQKDEGLVFVHQRPAALIVKRGESTQTIPIHDLTHIILVSLFGLTALCLYFLFRSNRRTRLKGES